MAQPGTITMSMRELDRLKVIQAVVEERLMARLSGWLTGIDAKVLQDWFHADEAGRAIISCRSICARRLWR